MSKAILALVVAASCLSVLLVGVEGHNLGYTITAVAGPTPTIDGVMTSGEWDDAYTMQFSNTVVCVKHDGEALYMAFNVSDNTINVAVDAVSIAIDVLHDGGSSLQPDDIFFFMLRNGTIYEEQGTNPPGPPTGGWNGSASSTSNYWQAEFNITYAKVQITSGESKILGVLLMKFDGVPVFWPPITLPFGIGPSNWGNLISEQNWIPEFPSFLILPLFMIATLLAVIVYKRKQTV